MNQSTEFIKRRAAELFIELPQLPKARIAGHFVLMATKLDGTQRKLAEFENLITDAGLERMGIGAFRNVCVVGTGSTAPDVLDVQLQSTTARTTGGAPSVPGSSTQSATPPYWAQTNTGYRFAVGAAAGNLTEVGIGWTTGSALSDYQLWARALIKNELGDPISVTVLGDEVLDVYYSMRIYPPTVDATYQCTIAGELYNCVSRAAFINSVQNWYVTSDRVLFIGLPGGAGFGVTNGAIGAITSAPSGVGSYSYYGPGNNAYSSNSKVQDGTLSWGLNDGNIPGGIRSILYQTSVGAYQTQFTLVTPRGDGSTTINKDNTKVLSIAFRVGWARRP